MLTKFSVSANNKTMPKKKPISLIKWTPLQVKIGELIAQNVKPADIAAQLQTYQSLVTKVKKAMSNPENPPPPGVDLTPKPMASAPLADNQKPSASAQEKVIEQFENQTEDEGAGEEVEDNGGQAEKVASDAVPPGTPTPDKVTKPPSKFIKSQPAADLTAQIQLVPVTATVGMTPIMLFARQYLTTKWNWRKDMPWENFFDTIISNWLDEHGVRVGWFEIDAKGEPIGEVVQAQTEEETVTEADLDPKTLAFGKLLVSEMVKQLGGNGHGS